MNDQVEINQELLKENSSLKQKIQDLEQADSARKRAEEGLAKSDEFYRSLFEYMLNGLAYCQMHFDDHGRPWDFTYLAVNSAFETLTGLRNVVGKKVSEIVPGIRESDPKLLEIYGRVSKIGKPERFEMFVDSLQMWFLISVYSPERGYFIALFDVITERKQAEDVLRESEAKYYDLYENAPDMYYSSDTETWAINECNETFLRKTGYSKEEVMGRSILELYDAGSIDESNKTLQQFKTTGEVRDVERRVKCKDGRIMDVSLSVSAIRDKNGNITHSRSIWRDITERKEHEAMIRALSITDQLTGLYNIRGFRTMAEQQLQMTERTKTGLLLLYADLDGLKKINDKLGHNSGDEAIVEAAVILKEVFRKMDIIARVGGDEFAVLALEASLEYSAMIKNRLRDQLALHNARAGRAYHLSFSVGMAYHDPAAQTSLDELISRADSMMYEQKRRKVTLEA
jgi:diguanylate cyclase (GGDEF)-like protein/PAS domain S-box-containing protein